MRKRGATWSKPRWPKGSIDILPQISRGGGPAKLVEGFLRAEGPLQRLRRSPLPANAGDANMKAPPRRHHTPGIPSPPLAFHDRPRPRARPHANIARTRAPVADV